MGSCVLGFRGDGRPWIQVQAYINACFQERRRFAANKNFHCQWGALDKKFAGGPKICSYATAKESSGKGLKQNDFVIMFS